MFIFFSGFAFAQIPRSAYVVNGIGESLSVINLENHSVIVNGETLGLFPNSIALRSGRAYVVNSGPNEIQVIDLATINTLHAVDVGNGTNPLALDFIDDDIAAVSLLFTNQVKFVNVHNSQLAQAVNVGAGPGGIVYSNGKVYVANSGFNGSGYDPGTVSVIDAGNYSVSVIAVGLNPQGLARDSQGNIIVACSGDYVSVGGEINVIDPASQQVIHSAPAGIAITGVAVSAADKAYFSTFASSVLVYDLQLQVFERGISNPLPGSPGLAFDAVDNAYITDFATDSVYVYSPSHQRLDGYLVGDGPLAIVIFDSIPNALPEPTLPVNRDFALYPNYPNPFNPSTNLGFRISDFGFIRLEIFDVTGRKVASLLNEELAPGEYEVNWDGKDDSGQNAPSGIYFYRLQVNGETQARKMHLLQ